MIRRLSILLVVLVALFGCAETPDYPMYEWEEMVPADAVKITPETDLSPPILHSDEFEEPVPLPHPISSAGAEDSPFFPANGDAFYFFHTPDVDVPIQEQLLDGSTGIWVSYPRDGGWSVPERVVVQDRNKLSLDGCTFVLDDVIWFCTAREGYTGLHWGTADFVDGAWTNWRVDDFPPEYEVGELHFSTDWQEVYFHSTRAGGKGENDIWMMQRVGDEWQEPVNVEAVNSEVGDGFPYLTPDGNELWFNRWHLGTPGTFRSKRVGGVWQEPELIVSMFAGEPTLDRYGNLYFVHHYYNTGQMLEADIYVANRKQ